MTPPTILVTGATGNVGGALARELDALGIAFRALVRGPVRGAGLPERAQRVTGDLGDPAALRSAFAGISKLFLVTPGIAIDHAAHAVAAAAAAGVQHIVHLSSFNVLGDPMRAMGRWHHQREQLIRASAIPATFLRPGGFMTNALDWLPTIRDGGFVLDPIGPGRYAPIDPADIAAVAGLVLTQDGHQGRAYVLTGDELFTVAEQVRILAGAIGSELEVRSAASAADAVRSRFPNGAPPALAAAILEGFELMRADTAGMRTDTVAQLLGRRPASFAAWCARHADAFRRPST